MKYELDLEKAQDKIRNTIDELVNHMQHSGSVIVATNKNTIYKNYFGYADILKKTLITQDTQFLAGSVTKKFAAVAILKALFDKTTYKNDHEKNKDDIQNELNNTIDHYLPAGHYGLTKHIE